MRMDLPGQLDLQFKLPHINMESTSEGADGRGKGPIITEMGK